MDVYQINNTGETETKIQQLQAPGFSGTFTVSYTIGNSVTLDLTGRVTGPMLLPVVPNDYRPVDRPWFGLINLQVSKAINKNFDVYGWRKNFQLYS
ncbi:MAG: hypothetical protein U5K54_26750 [Cytophagales bacterium]|nr:hypothetical protein [Cytophagales bacterium]